MGIGLKNTLDLISGNVALWDFAVNEQCYDYAECNMYAPFQTGNGGREREGGRAGVAVLWRGVGVPIDRHVRLDWKVTCCVSLPSYSCNGGGGSESSPLASL